MVVPHSKFSLSKEERMQIEGIGKRCKLSSVKYFFCFLVEQRPKLLPAC